MSIIEIRRTTGDAETRKLSKTQPLSIGTHTSNDLCIEEEGVALLHCRISWNKNVFEVVAANTGGVELNGTLVQHSVLRPGDVLHVGSVDINYVGDNPRATKASSSSRSPANEAGSVQAADDVETQRKSLKTKGNGGSDKSAGAQSPVAVEAVEEDIDAFDDGWDDPSGVAEQQTSDKEQSSFKTKWKRSSQEPEKAGSPAWKSRISSGRARPGEQDAMRSPFVLLLIGGSLALLLAAFTFWYMIDRTGSQGLYDSATGEMETGRYAQAILIYKDFLERYPNHKLVSSAEINRGKCRIFSHIKGAAPIWDAGLKSVDEFLVANRDRENFSELHPDIVEFGSTIALGAAADALKSNSMSSTARRELLAQAAEGRKLVDRYASRDEPPVQLIGKIEAAVQSADNEILKQETFDDAVAQVEKAIEASNPMDAFEGRRNLLNRYSAFQNDPKIAALLERILETEKSFVKSEQLVREAVVDEREGIAGQTLSLTLHTRSRTDTVSEERTVVVLSKDCCYGIDSITGEPKWRRVIGFDTPFFPISVSASVPGLLMFDTNHLELLVVDRGTGKLVWRQPLGETLSGAPLVDEGQIFLPTLSNHLYKIDLDAGRLSTRLTFSQKVHSPPVFDAERKKLIVAGDREVLYTVTVRPFECVAVSFVGHQPGSLQAPLLTMGGLVLMATNDRMQSGQLRIFDTRNPEGRLTSIATSTVEGIVRDLPTLRGNQLFVTSSGPWISSFIVSDIKNQPPVSPGPRVQLTGGYDGPLFLQAGPDGQLWLASNALRKLQLTANSITEDPRKLASGMSSQPLQIIGRNLYVGRRLPYSGAVLFSQADRQEMKSHWRTVLGGSILELSIADPTSLICVTEDGTAYRINEQTISTGGFKRDADSRLQLPDDLTVPLRAVELSTGRIGVHSSGEQPQLWVINRLGQVERQVPLPQTLEANPVQLAAGLVLPLPGRFRLLGQRGQSKKIEDYLSPVGEEEESRWTYLAALDETQFIALNNRGLLGRYQFRSEPVPHIDVAQSIEFEKPIDKPVESASGKVFAVDADGELMMLDAVTLDTLSTLSLEEEALNPPWFVNNQLYLNTARSGLICFGVGTELAKVWNVDLGGVRLSGRPHLIDGLLVVALEDGDIMAVSADSGQVRGRMSLGQPLSGGPTRFGTHLLVPSIDGSLHRIDSILQTVSQ